MQKGRIIAEHKTNYQILADDEEYIGTVRGVFYAEQEFPKVGDYVEFEVVSENKVVIGKICPRKSVVSRKAAGAEETQVIVANVDYIFVVMGLDGDFNLSRLERYLMLAKQSDTPAVVILNKKDSVEDFAEYVDQVKAIAPEVPVHAVSALTGDNMDTLTQYFDKDATVVLLGSSGAGKSTMTNWLLSEDRQAVRGVRTDDSRGKHTTTTRHLFTLPTGGYLIDTPGMRELGLQDTTEEDEGEIFEVIERLSGECRFNNCDHEKSAGCAVLAAVEKGDVSERQLASYQKLQRERLHEESKHDDELSLKAKKQKKKLLQSYNKIQEQKRFEKGLDSGF